jgi:Holliday junction resolvase RusA-like endonuclease
MSGKAKAGAYVVRKPDYDNLAKLLGDALNGAVYKDDAAIADGRVVKRYVREGERARCEVRVWELDT